MGRKAQYSEEQIIRALQEVDAGAKATEVCRRLGVTETTFYRWKSKYGGMDVSDAKRLKALLHSYAYNNPVSSADPSGLEGLDNIGGLNDEQIDQTTEAQAAGVRAFVASPLYRGPSVRARDDGWPWNRPSWCCRCRSGWRNGRGKRGGCRCRSCRRDSDPLCVGSPECFSRSTGRTHAGEGRGNSLSNRELRASTTGESQYWSLTSPFSPGYTSQMGMPGMTPNIAMGGTLAPGTSFITNESAALGAAGNGIQVVTAPGAVLALWFSIFEARDAESK